MPSPSTLYSVVYLVCIVIPTAITESTKAQLLLPDDVLRHILYVEPNLHLRRLGNVSDVDGSLKRTFLDNGHRRAAALLIRWMRSAGMTSTSLDAVGNVRGRANSVDPDAPAMFVGSHYDTVVDGGIFDGALGVITGIAAVKAIILEAAIEHRIVTPEQLTEAVKDLSGKGERGEEATLHVPYLLKGKDAQGFVLGRPVEVVGFSDEEGVRFQSTFLGSKALAGSLVSSGALQVQDIAGTSLTQALQAAGMEGSAHAIEAAALKPGAAAGYVEVHLEQGPILEKSGQAVGVVKGIAGQTRMLAVLRGQQGHAGTVPMKLRHDPLAAAAELMVHMERICAEDYREKDDSLVCTVGSLSLWPGASNVIPGATNFTIDVRSQSDDIRNEVLQKVQRAMDEICTRRGLLQCGLQIRHEAQAVHCDEGIVKKLAEAVQESHKNILPHMHLVDKMPFGNDAAKHDGTCAASSVALPAPLLKLVSGAGHDAMAMASVTPVGMLFVRCRGGISHSPAEWVEPEDVAIGAASLLQFLRSWQQQSNSKR